MNVVTIGSVFVDIKGYPQRDFSPKGRNSGQIEYFHGGVARNIADSVAGIGENSILVGLVDESSTGADVIDHLKEHGVNTDYMRAVPGGMGTWMVVFDQYSDIAANLSQRPNLLPINDILKEKGDEIFSAADSILVEADLEEEILETVFSLAEKYDVPIYGAISNIQIALDRMAYIRRLSCFVVNQEEAGALFHAFTDYFTPDEMVDFLARSRQRDGMPPMIVTMDSRGAAYSGNNKEKGLVDAKRVNVVDSTGAGDSFFSAVAVALTMGKNLGVACKYGVEIASAVIETKENVYIPKK